MNKTPGKISREEGRSQGKSQKKMKQLQQNTIQVPENDVPSHCLKENTYSFNPFCKRKPFISKHHLDDSQARAALEFPSYTLRDHTETRIKRKSQDYKKHIYQDEINKE